MAITRIYKFGGEDIPFTRKVTFPDGQPHITLDFARGVFGRLAVIETALTNADDVLEVLLAADVLHGIGYRVNLDVRYLIGARMDRRIAPGQPETLRVIAALLRCGGFDHIRILDPHSDVCLGLLDAEPVYPTLIARGILNLVENALVIIPDEGARWRVGRRLGVTVEAVQCLKTRDPNTGRLSDFVVTEPTRVAGRHCLIVDDLCDGGGTFVGLAEKLREAQAVSVDLFVTHAIMSKGLVLEGVDRIFATDSYTNHGTTPTFLTVPISMEDL